MAFDAGDVVIVPFPFSHIALAKSRPALVLSAEADNTACGATVLAIVTTAADSAWPRDTRLEDWRGYGLRGPCVVRAKFFTLDNRLITRRLASLSERDRAAIREGLSGVIAL
jgi:mRNA interferase MazF